MVPNTLKNRILLWLEDLWDSVECFFAKRWLDKNFGEKEYWDEYMSRLQFEQRQIDLRYKQIQENIRQCTTKPLIDSEMK